MSIESPLMDLIGNLGVPIAVMIYLFYRESKYQDKQLNVMNELIDVVKNNNQILNKLMDKV